MKRNKAIYKKIKRYFHKTWKNKVAALGIMAVGFLTVLLETDITAFVFTLMIGLPLFFAKDNWMLW